jgi:fermentation-respiration switch protein FrsA (DUF1100 family)
VKISVIALGLSSIGLFAQKPQDPIAPFNYIAEDVFFQNAADSISLAGTFTIPKGKKGFPTVVLISGSGPQNRDSELLGHRPFLVIADYLTNNGIAVLRIDDRGTAASGGDYGTAGLSNFKSDTEAAILYLRSRKEVDPSKIGLIGHSLGGVIAPMIACEDSTVAFIVLLAGSGIRGDELMLLQKATIERKMGISEVAIAVGQEQIGGAYKIITESEVNGSSFQEEIKDYFTNVFGNALGAAQIELLSKQLSTPWLADFIRYDPAECLSQVRCPVLALNGANDTQVPATINLEAIKRNAEKNGNKDVTTMEFPELNHLFQHSTTGMPLEYAGIEETFSPEVLQIMANWINSRTK